MSNYSTSSGASRPKLSDILNGSTSSLADVWNQTAPAQDFAPLPLGEYITRVVAGELAQSKTGTPCYRLSFKVVEGEFSGRRLWHDCYLTPAAMPMSKRDLAKLGIVSPQQMEAPLPQGIRCSVKVALRTGENGAQYNRVKGFEVVGIDAVDDPDFGPSGTPEADDPSSPVPKGGDDGIPF